MKTIALAFVAALISGSAWAQVPALPTVNPLNVPNIVTATGNAVFAAGVTKLDVAEVRHIPLFNVPGGTTSQLSTNLNNFLILVKPAP